ncbi:MAG TPA: GerMN domain-containing protein [Iamia sp.]
MSRGAALLVLGGLLLGGSTGLAACGIPTDGEPRPLADETTTTTTLVGEADAVATVYLVGTSNQLEPAIRPLKGASSPQTVLDALLVPPSEDEAEEGLTSYIPDGTTALGVEVDDGLAIADMSAEWEGLADPTATTAYAQVVLTLTDLPDVERVQFLIEGQEIAAPTAARGQQAIVTADDYALLVPESGPDG